MKNDMRTRKQLIHELALSQIRIRELESLSGATAVIPRPLSDPEEAAGGMLKAFHAGVEEMLQDRINELLDENGRLSAEIDRLKGGIDWIQQYGKRFGNMDRLIPLPALQEGEGRSGGKDFEDRLQQAQKMEAVGALAGGIAHDFNNILTAIIASASLMQRGIETGSPLRRHLDRIFAAAERATALTQSILAYSRRQPSTPLPIKLNIIVENLRKLLSRLVPENITFDVSLAESDLLIMADIGQIEHVIMNLVANSVDAMPAGGELAIRTSLSDASDARGLPNYMAPGDYALLTVEDTGSGMDASTRERLFEPFFTTKEVGKGTGLGLAMAYGIVKQHNGYIDVRSEAGRGTAFAVYFPLIDDNLKGGVNAYSPPVATGKETILLIEDDTDVRNLLKEMLEGYGYRVIEAVDGADGVEKFRIHQEEIRLILSDVMMPGRNGKEAFNDIRRIRGDIRAIFMSGYSFTATTEILGEGMDFLAKPVSPLELLTKIRGALDK